MQKSRRVRIFDSDSANRKSKIENPKWLGLSIIAFVLVCGATAQAQQPRKGIPRIGYLATPSHSFISDRYDAFVQGLRELGYIEGKNIAIERRSADGKVERLPGLAAELVRLKVDIIVTGGAGINPFCQGSHRYNSHYHGARFRSCGNRLRQQLGAAWREHHRIINPFP